MTKRDFLLLVIKLIGVYVVAQILFINLPFDLLNFSYPLIGISYKSITMSIVPAVFGVWAWYVLVFKPHIIVNLFSLDKGFDEDRIEFGNLNEMELIKIGLIATGCLILVDYGVTFLSQSYFYLENRIRGVDRYLMTLQNRFVAQTFIESALGTAVGFLVLTNYKRIAQRLSRKPLNEG